MNDGKGVSDGSPHRVDITDGGVVRRRECDEPRGARARSRVAVSSNPGRGRDSLDRRPTSIAPREAAQHQRAPGLRLLQHQVRRPRLGPRDRRRQPTDDAPRDDDRHARWVRIRAPRRHGGTQRPGHPAHARHREDPRAVQLRRARPRAHHRPSGAQAPRTARQGRGPRVDPIAQILRTTGNRRRVEGRRVEDRADGERQRADQGGVRGLVRAQERPGGGHQSELGGGLGGERSGL